MPEYLVHERRDALLSPSLEDLDPHINDKHV